ncbi:MAG: hypothetical protein KDJ68_16050 [Rhodobiaceae bacterium]|nr:hypothetical protein [Rhodobiaceae bacterium]
MTELKCYRITENASPIAPGRSQRDWMEATPSRFAYRCLPLSIANSSGWEIRMKAGVSIYWNGGSLIEDFRIVWDEGASPADHNCGSHFGSGIVTFHTGYLFRTDPGWAIWARGAPNAVKDGIQALEGLIETDWLPFPFTMNWQMTRPGHVRFEAGEPYCFITPVQHQVLDTIEPQMYELAENPELASDYRAWSQSRNEFNARLKEQDPEAIKQGWQRNYMRGHMLDGTPVNGPHVSKRLLAKPRPGKAPR